MTGALTFQLFRKYTGLYGMWGDLRTYFAIQELNILLKNIDVDIYLLSLASMNRIVTTWHFMYWNSGITSCILSRVFHEVVTISTSEYFTS